MEKQMITRFNPIIIISCVFLVFGSCSESQGQVPTAVQQNFEQQYPGENDPDWHTDKNGNFEANFKIDGKKYRADYSPKGNWIETERSIDEDDLPKVILDILEEKFDDWDINEIEEVQHHSKGMFYDVELKDGKDKIDIEFKADGQIIN
jgi:hypothetical protein